MLKSWCSVLLISIISGAVSTAMGGQPLETESARLAARGTLKVEAGLERQTSADGSEANVPAALEYSPADRVEIRWPSGAVDRIEALAAGFIYTIKERSGVSARAAFTRR